MRGYWVGLWGVLCLAASVAAAQEVFMRHAPGAVQYGPWGQTQGPADLTIEQQRKLGLSDEQVQKIAEKRRDIEKERAALAAQLKVAEGAARAANEEVARLSREMTTVLTQKITKVYESLMDEAQLKAWKQQRFIEQAKQWLTGFKAHLKLTDAQVDDIANMLVPVYEKYGKMETEMEEAKERLAELRRADKIDIAAIDKAEKEVAQLSLQSIWKLRQDELMEKMRGGLMPDQLERFDQTYRRH